MTATAALPDFEGQEVRQASVRITNAGDGLSEALKVAPIALHHGQEVHYVLRGRVADVNHRQKDEDDPLVRVHTVKATAITPIAPELAEKLLGEAAAELRKAKAEAEGHLQLPDGEPELGE